MSGIDIQALAREMLSAFTSGGTVAVPPSTRYPDLDLNTAYAVEAEFVRLRGRQTAGFKVGYANKALWRVLKLDTLVWAHMYDDTVHYAAGNAAELTLPYDRSAKIEPEIVFKLKEPITSSSLDAATVLQHVDWMAIGFEIIDCPFPGWQFKPADFVAAFGLHLALIVGSPVKVDPGMVPALASFRIRVSKDGQLVEEGSGKNSLRSPALCLAELARTARLSAGDLVSTGTLTSGHPIGRGEAWQVEIVDGLPLPGLTLRLN